MQTRCVCDAYKAWVVPRSAKPCSVAEQSENKHAFGLHPERARPLNIKSFLNFSEKRLMRIIFQRIAYAANYCILWQSESASDFWRKHGKIREKSSLFWRRFLFRVGVEVNGIGIGVNPSLLHFFKQSRSVKTQ